MVKVETAEYTQIGTVEARGEDMVRIRWDDDQREKVPLSALPAAFAGFEEGQRFELKSMRRLDSYEIVSISGVVALNPDQAPSKPAEAWVDTDEQQASQTRVGGMRGRRTIAGEGEEAIDGTDDRRGIGGSYGRAGGSSTRKGGGRTETGGTGGRGGN